MKFRISILLSFISLIMISSLINCKSTKDSNLPINLTNINEPIGEIYEYDSTKFIKHKSGFYLTKKGDVFQQNSVAYDDSSGLWSMHYWMDSLMFYGEYPNRKSLKEIIDIETFKQDSLSSYEKDKNNVYFSRGSSDGVRRFLVNKADPKSFKGLGEYYGKDKLNVFYRYEIIKNVDIKTFQTINDGDSAKDKNHYYHFGERIEN